MATSKSGSTEMTSEKADPLLGKKLKVINVGVELFAEELRKQGVEVAHVDFKPPRKLDKDIEDVLSRII